MTNLNTKGAFGGSGGGNFYGSVSSDSFTGTTSTAILFQMDFALMLIFMVDFAFRAIINPNKLSILKAPITYIEIIAIGPYLIYLCGSTNSTIQQLAIVSSLCRCFLLFKLFRFVESLTLLAHAVRKAYKELIIYMLYLGLAVIIFSTWIYFLEQLNSSTTYYSIPAAAWWAVITLTTVGYGDIYPV